MYKNIYYDRKVGKIHLWDDQEGHKVLSSSKYKYGYILSSKKTEWKNLKGQYVEKVNDKSEYQESDLFESDLRTEYRVLLDEYLNKAKVPENLNIVFLDIEVEKTETGYSTVKNPIGRILSIAIKNKRTNEAYLLILDEEKKLECPQIDYKIITVQTEKDLLLYFYKIYESLSPDILTGWNIDFYDIPYIYNRTLKILNNTFATKLSPIGIVDKDFDDDKQRYKIAGVCTLDYLRLYKNVSIGDNPSYSLDYICKKELGRGKVKYSGSLYDLYKKDPIKFIQYNTNDVDLVIELDDKLQFIDLAINTCIDGYVDFESFYFPSAYLDGAGIAFLRNKGIVADNKKSYEKKEFAGAYVKKPIAGFFKWVFDLDLTSLYPSIIRSLNISPETIVGKVFNWESSDFLGGNSLKTYTIEYSEDGSTVTFNQEDLLSYLKNHKYSIAANGSFYRNDFRGFLPSILDEWFTLRVEYKKKMQEYMRENDSINSQRFFTKQYTQKIKLNTFYGVLALKSYRFYNLWNAEAITLTGQNIIQTSEKIADQYYNDLLNTNDNYVIGMDTDSLFLSLVPILNHLYPEYEKWNESKVVEKSLEEIKKIQDYINSFYDIYAISILNCQGTHYFKMKQELFAKSGIWIGVKKRYGLYIINEEGVPVSKLKAVGLDNVRSDFPGTLRILMDEILDLLLNKMYSKDQIKEYIMAWYSGIKKISDDEEILGIMFPTSVQELSKYDSKELFIRKKGTPIHVNSSLNYNDFLNFKKLTTYSPITDGQKIKWSYLKNNPLRYNTISINEEDMCPEAFKYIKDYIDVEKNIQSALVSKLQSYYTALNWGVVELELNSQLEFFDF